MVDEIYIKYHLLIEYDCDDQHNSIFINTLLVNQVSVVLLQRGIVLLIRLIWILLSKNLSIHLLWSTANYLKQKFLPSDSAFLAPAVSLVILKGSPKEAKVQGVPTAVSLFTSFSLSPCAGSSRQLSLGLSNICLWNNFISSAVLSQLSMELFLSFISIR